MDNTALDHLRQAQEAFDAALRSLDDPAVVSEDRPLDPALVAQALDHFTQAADGFAASEETTLEAQARIGLAEVLLKTIGPGPAARTQLRQAEQSARTGVERLDSVREPALTLRGLLALAKAGRYVAELAPELREARLITTSSLLDGAAYVAKELGDDVLDARVGAETCCVVSQRFDGERDEKLMDAIGRGEEAIAAFHRAGSNAFEHAALLHHLGNCCMTVAGDRAHWLSKGREFYREGAAVVDARRYPRLQRMLDEHVAMVDTLLQNNDFALPDKEMVARYGSGITTALKDSDAETARRLGWGFLAWGWSVQPNPNVHVGEAHKALAKVAFARGDWDDAQQHLYHSLGVLSAVLSERDRWYYLVGEARDLFKQAIERNGQGASLESWLQRAVRSFVDGDAACVRAARIVDRDPAAALPEFELALNLFPCHPAAHFYRGAIRSRIGDLAGAIADYDFMLTLKPKSTHTLANRGVVKKALGDEQGAVADLDEALKLQPGNPELEKIRAEIMKKREQGAQA